MTLSTKDFLSRISTEAPPLLDISSERIELVHCPDNQWGIWRFGGYDNQGSFVETKTSGEYCLTDFGRVKLLSFATKHEAEVAAKFRQELLRSNSGVLKDQYEAKKFQ